MGVSKLIRHHPSSPSPRKPRKLYDSRGLYLEIAPRGSKARRFKYRFADKGKSISLGLYPDVSLKLAQQRRDESRQLLAQEIDSSAYRKAQKQSKHQWARNSFEAVGWEWLAKHLPNWTTAHASRVRHQLERDVFPWIGTYCRAHGTGVVGRGAEDRRTRRLEDGPRHAANLWTGVALAGPSGTHRGTCAAPCRRPRASICPPLPIRSMSARCCACWTAIGGCCRCAEPCAWRLLI